MPLASYDNPPALSHANGVDEHLIAALDWLRRLVAWRIDVTRQTYGPLADDEHRGLYIPDGEADILSAATPDLPPHLFDMRNALAEERAAGVARAQAAALAGRPAALHKLVQLFGLSPFERDVLLLALAPEIDQRYERLYAYIQDDVTRKQPSIALAFQLLCTEPGEQIRARAVFTPDAPLLRHQLIQLYDDGPRQGSLLGRLIRLDDRIVAELLGQPMIDPLLSPYVALTRPTRPLHDLVLPEDLIARLRQTLSHQTGGLILGLQGSYGSGRGVIAEALCADAGLPLLAVDLERLLEGDTLSGAGPLAPEDAARRLTREAALQGAAMLWHGADRILGDPSNGPGEGPRAWRLALLAALDAHDGHTFLALEHAWEARGALRRGRFLRVELPAPTYSERERLWRARLNGDSPDDATIQALASTFRLSGGRIRDAVAMARSLAHWNGGNGAGPALSAQDLYAACRAQSSGRLDSLAHKISATYTWGDIVLPPDQTAQLREICLQVRYRRIVLERWGFDRHLAMGKGVNILFAGPSGTGKTMAAEIIAADLGQELYKVDLATMVSKYIGETEKNLDRIFTAAREANAILFFDEADSIFGKRSEVKDAHDRYANVEVGYLLQKMEEYDGVVILATNLRKNLDDAFIRRLHVAIDFPFPDEADRLRIWRKVFPPEAPLAEDVDLAFLAKQFKLAGGNIRNIGLLAAFLAAETGGPIGMKHLVYATGREYQKLGKLITAADFGPYMALMKRET